MYKKSFPSLNFKDKNFNEKILQIGIPCVGIQTSTLALVWKQRKKVRKKTSILWQYFSFSILKYFLKFCHMSVSTCPKWIMCWTFKTHTHPHTYITFTSVTFLAPSFWLITFLHIFYIKSYFCLHPNRWQRVGNVFYHQRYTYTVSKLIYTSTDWTKIIVISIPSTMRQFP